MPISPCVEPEADDHEQADLPPRFLEPDRARRRIGDLERLQLYVQHAELQSGDGALFPQPAFDNRFAPPGGGYRYLDGPAQYQTGLAPDSSYYAGVYGSISDGGYIIPAVPYQQINQRYYRQEVADPFGEAPGTIIVDTKDLSLPDAGRRTGDALWRRHRPRRLCLVGRGVIQWKQAWPRWKPPNEMVARQPHLEPYSIANGGMEPGLMNPLGARAMYIFKDGQDTLYRLHGTPEWNSIGKAVSSGCVRLINQDVIDLYDRVRVKAPILVV